MMIFIVGGAWQGKRKFAESLLLETTGEIVDQFHLYVKEQVHLIFNKENRESLLEQVKVQISCKIENITRNNPPAIVIIDEIGCGIVPVQPEDRIYRDLAGYAGQLLAEKAEIVYRVTAGIGVKIKDAKGENT